MRACGGYVFQLLHRSLVFSGLGFGHGFFLPPSPSSLSTLVLTQNATIESEGGNNHTITSDYRCFTEATISRPLFSDCVHVIGRIPLIPYSREFHTGSPHNVFELPRLWTFQTCKIIIELFHEGETVQDVIWPKIKVRAEHLTQACCSDTWPQTTGGYSYVGASQEISVTLGFNHANVVGLQENEMRLSILKRYDDFRCFSSHFLILPFFDDCQRAIQKLPVIGYGTFHWDYPHDPFELPRQTSWGTCKVGIELVDPTQKYPGLRWSEIVSKAFDLNFVCGLPCTGRSRRTTGGSILLGRACNIRIALGYNYITDGPGQETTVASVSPFRVPIESISRTDIPVSTNANVPLSQRNNNYYCFMTSPFLTRPSYQDCSVAILQLPNFETFGIFHKGEPHDDWELPIERSFGRCRVYVEMVGLARDHSTWTTIVLQAYNLNVACVKEAVVTRTYGGYTLGGLHGGIRIKLSLPALAAFGENRTLTIGRNETTNTLATKVNHGDLDGTLTGIDIS